MAPSSTHATDQGDEQVDGATPSIARLDTLLQRLEGVMGRIGRMHLAEYVVLFQNPRRLLWLNFLSGIARGLGTAIGFALLSVVLVYILQKLMLLNLPLVGDFIAQLVRVVQTRMALIPGP